MDFKKVIYERESIRHYDRDRKVADDVLERILDAGRVAPSAANRQPWRFVVVSSEDMLQKVYDCYRGDWLRDAPHVLIVVGDKDAAWVRKLDEYNALETDCTIAMDHMILAAENEGVGTCWIAAFDEKKLREKLKLKKNEVVFAMTPLGYTKSDFIKKGAKDRKLLQDIVTYL